ncbi:uncharacterized protein RAG0_02796 [Rhynchosporium agropyri]|uniref:Single-strand DNA deaminase toxin A-like C-terminal domain-containing protein n=1 Tax=Rhynchosporium agropyri TaxID=914238 RepID=A0A1E1K2T8_9HELO|nr:uncharacterized protein RAG0_02796 [Rhynchosporium agropyri]
MKKNIASAKNIPAAFVLNWTTARVEIICPFASCDEKVHGHGYTPPSENYLNTREAHCYRQLRYRLLFPYEDDPLVRDFGFLLDRQNLKRRTIANGLEDPRIDEAEERLSTLLHETRLSNSSHNYSLDSKDVRQFLSDCVNDEYLSCKHQLETSKQLEVLVKGKDSCSGKTALSFVSEEGHLEIAKLLCEHGAELESVDNNGRTPVMLAILHGRGQNALHLARLGASLFVKDKAGTTLIQTAKTAFQKLSEWEWAKAKTPIYGSEMGSSEAMEQVDIRNRALKDIKERKEGLNPYGKVDDSFCIIQRNKLHRPRVSLSKVLFETDMDKERKTFAFLDRGRPFESIQAAAVSGYTAGTVGDSDGCLNRDLWTSTVMKYCRAIGHELAQIDQYGRPVPEIFHASHAEKQLMAYFLWMHTTMDRNFEESNDEGELWGSSDELRELYKSKPDVASLKKDIYVSREPCDDCKRFQQRVLAEEGVCFNFLFIKPIAV